MFSPVLHAAVSPDGLLHVGVALRDGPGPRQDLRCALGGVVPVAPLAASTSAAATSTATAAATARWWCGTEATQPVLAAALEVVLCTGE